MFVLLCKSCDAIRDTERAYCSSCGEATDSYAYEPSEREAFAMRSACFDGEIVSPSTAAEIRQLGMKRAA